jgi:hypothetical protein
VLNRLGHITTESGEYQVGLDACLPAHASADYRPHETCLLGESIVTSEAWEPDALTAHVRICEGANSILQGHDIVTPLWETSGQQGTQTVS